MATTSFRFTLPQLFWLTALCALFVGLLTSSDEAQRQSRPQSIAFSPDGRWLFCSMHGTNSFDAKLRLWELQGNRAIGRRCSFRTEPYGPGVSFVTSEILVSASNFYSTQGTGLLFWNVVEDREVKPPRTLMTDHIPLLVASEAGKVLLVKNLAAGKTASTLLDVHDWSEHQLPDMDCTEQAITTDGKYIIGQKNLPFSYSLVRLNSASGEELELGGSPYVNLFCSRNGNRLVLSGYGSFNLEAITATEVRILDDVVTSRSLSLGNSTQFLALSPDGSLGATTNADGELLLFRLDTLDALHTWRDFVHAIPDRWIAWFPPLRMWNYDYGRSAAFSPDGQRLAVATSRGIAWYDVTTGERVGWLWRPQRFQQSLIYIVGFLLWPFVWAYVSGRRALGVRVRPTNKAPLDAVTATAHWGMEHGGPFIVGFGTLFLWGVIRFARPQMLAESISLLVMVLLVVVFTIGVMVALELLLPGRSRLLRAKQLAKRPATILNFTRGRFWSLQPQPLLADLNAACDDAERHFAEITGLDVKLGRGLAIVIAETEEEFVAHSPKQPPQQYLVFHNFLEKSVLYSRQTIEETLYPWSRAVRAGLGHLLLLKSIGQKGRPTWQTMLLLNAVTFPPARRHAALAATTRAMRLVTSDMRPYFAAYLRGDARELDGLRQFLAEQSPRNRYYDLFAGIAFFCMDYFCGVEAPADRRGKFRRLLAERPTTASGERTFESVFGFNYEQLADALNTLYLSADADWFGVSTEEGQQLISDNATRILADPYATQPQRDRVVTGLGYCGVLRGLDLLLPLLERPDLVESDRAVAALQQLTGQSFGHQPATWQAWVEAIPLPIKLGERSGTYRDGSWSIDAPQAAGHPAAISAIPQVIAENSGRTTPIIPPLPTAIALEHAAMHPPEELRLWVWQVLFIAAAWGIVYAIGAMFTLGPQAMFPLICLCSGVYALLIVAMRDAPHARLASSWLMANLLLCDIPTATLALIVYWQTPATKSIQPRRSAAKPSANR